MHAIMKDESLKTIEQLRLFLEGTAEVDFGLACKADRYAWVQKTAARFQYLTLGKAERGVMIRYLVKVTGYSRQQLTRLLRQFRQCGRVQRRQKTAAAFPRRFTAADVRLLAQVDQWHGTLSGPATKKLLERAWRVFEDAEYQRLSTLSVSHLYNLRRAQGYVRCRVLKTATRPVQIPIGQRRKPQPQGLPGYLRIDSVHQGDFDGVKGVYHINAVDEVTQFEIVATVERISEADLIPVLQVMLEDFPFVIRGFHSDNGSEYINGRVAELLGTLLVEFTKSRSRHSNDNALAESKNGAVVRKHWGYAHLPQKYAARLNAFNRQYLNPYLNFHRPCFFPEVVTDAKGKQRKRYPYRCMMTPYEKLKSLPGVESHLKPGLSLQQLDQTAKAQTDHQAAQQLQTQRRKLFQSISAQEQRVA
ncbi:MAG: integrase catalytic domain-containing protein [Stenotrophobium sp.]